MLNLNVASHPTPSADDTTARRAEYDAMLDRTVALAVDAIGQGLDVKSDVIIAASYPFAVTAARQLISVNAAGKQEKGAKKSLLMRILVGLTLKGRTVFRGQFAAASIAFDGLGAARSADSIALEIDRMKTGGAKYLTSIDNFLRNADALVTLAHNKANRGLCTACFKSADEAIHWASYRSFAAPLAAQVMIEAKKLKKVDPNAKVKTFAEKLEAYLNKAETSEAGVSEMDLAEAITLLQSRHNAMVAQAAIVAEAQAMRAANENAEPELLTGTNG